MDVRRTRTPSVLKWALNERAKLAGDLTREKALLEQERKELDRLTARVKYRGTRVRNLVTRLAELDGTLAALDQADTEVAPVQAHDEGYDGRGGIVRLVMSEIANAGPNGVATTQLIAAVLACAADGGPATTGDKRRRANNVRRTLQKLRDRQRVESVRVGGPTCEASWFLFGAVPKSLRELIGDGTEYTPGDESGDGPWL